MWLEQIEKSCQLNENENSIKKFDFVGTASDMARKLQLKSCTK